MMPKSSETYTGFFVQVLSGCTINQFNFLANKYRLFLKEKCYIKLTKKKKKKKATYTSTVD